MIISAIKAITSHLLYQLLVKSSIVFLNDGAVLLLIFAPKIMKLHDENVLASISVANANAVATRNGTAAITNGGQTTGQIDGRRESETHLPPVHIDGSHTQTGATSSDG